MFLAVLKFFPLVTLFRYFILSPHTIFLSEEQGQHTTKDHLQNFELLLTCAFANFFSNRSRSLSVCWRRLLSSTMSPFNEARAAK